MLPFTYSRKVLLACRPFPPWNLPSFTVEFTLLSPCSRSDPPLFLANVQLSPILTLPPQDLVRWTDGSVPFPFDKGSSGVLANCFLYGTEATLSFSAGRLCSSFSAEACAILHALCWSRQHQQACHFSFFLLLSHSRPVLSYLKLFGRNCLFCPPVLSDYNGSPDTRFSQGTTRLMSWTDRERYLRPPQSPAVSLLLSQTGGVLPHLNSLTRRLPRFPQRNLCSFVTPVVFSLVYAAMDTAFC